MAVGTAPAGTASASASLVVGPSADDVAPPPPVLPSAASTASVTLVSRSPLVPPHAASNASAIPTDGHGPSRRWSLTKGDLILRLPVRRRPRGASPKRS